jgi:hypothetical protein
LDKTAGLPEPFSFEIQTTSSADFRSWITYYKGAPPEQSVFAIAAQMLTSDRRPARRALIMFRDPWEHSPGWGSAYGQYVERRHDFVISMLKEAAVPVYVIGIDEPSTRPRIPNDIGQNYGTTFTGSGSAMRASDQEFRKAMDILMNAGRVNLERISKQTGGMVAYGSKKNYTDAVPQLISAVEGSAPSPAGK